MANEAGFKKLGNVMVTGIVEYSNLNHPRENKRGDLQSYISLSNPSLSNPWKADADVFKKAQAWFDEHVKTENKAGEKYDNPTIFIKRFGTYPIETMYDLNANKSMKLPLNGTTVNEVTGEVLKDIKEPINCQLSIDVQILHFIEQDTDSYSFNAWAIDSFDAIKFYQPNTDGSFGAQG